MSKRRKEFDNIEWKIEQKDGDTIYSDARTGEAMIKGSNDMLKARDQLYEKWKSNEWFIILGGGLSVTTLGEAIEMRYYPPKTEANHDYEVELYKNLMVVVLLCRKNRMDWQQLKAVMKLVCQNQKVIDQLHENTKMIIYVSDEFYEREGSNVAVANMIGANNAKVFGTSLLGYFIEMDKRNGTL